MNVVEMANLISEEIKKHQKTRLKMLNNYEKYKGNVPIKNRELPIANKINKKIANDFRGYITDQHTGYLFGNPVSYSLNDENERNKEEFKTFKRRNMLDDLDAETGKYMSICGSASRLSYINKEGLESVKNIKPWECIYIYDEVGDILYAIRYYFVFRKRNGENKQVIRAEFYDNKYVYYFIENEKGEYSLEIKEGKKNPELHLFDYVPLLEFPNNEERMGDWEKVESEIDAYDETVSDTQNEIEQFRLAYMVFYGVNIDKETLEMAQQTGAFGGLKTDSKIEFLTKDINDTLIENQKKTLKQNIHKFSSTIDLTDENFSGNVSGIALEHKLQALENRAKMKERKFTNSVNQMFKVLSSSWKRRKFDIDYLDVEVQFTRNLPVDLEYQANIAQKLKGFVSEDTRLSLLEFIKDVEIEKEKMKEDSEGMESLFNMNVVDENE